MFDFLLQMRSLLDETIWVSKFSTTRNQITQISKCITRMLDCEKSKIYLSDPSRGELWTYARTNTSEKIKMDEGVGIQGYCFKNKEILNIRNPHLDNRFHQEGDLKSGTKTTSILCVPIKSHKMGIIGVIMAINKKPKFSKSPKKRKRRGERSDFHIPETPKETPKKTNSFCTANFLVKSENKLQKKIRFLTGDFFTQADEKILEKFSTYTSNILETSMSQDKKNVYHADLRKMLDLGNELSTFHSLQSLCAGLEQLMKKVFFLAEIRLLVIKPCIKENKLKFHFFKKIDLGENSPSMEIDEPSIGAHGAPEWSEAVEDLSGLAQKCYLMDKFLVLKSCNQCPDFNAMVDLDTSLPTLVFPVRNLMDDEIIGVVEMTRLRSIEGIQESEANPLKSARISEREQQMMGVLEGMLARCLDSIGVHMK